MYCDRYFITLTGACDFLALGHILQHWNISTTLYCNCINKRTFEHNFPSTRLQIVSQKTTRRNWNHLGRHQKMPIFTQLKVWILKPLQPWRALRHQKHDQIFIVQHLEKFYTKGQPHQTNTDWEIDDLLYPCLPLRATHIIFANWRSNFQNLYRPQLMQLTKTTYITSK